MVLALDYGTKRIGVATGGRDAGIAFAKGVIFNKGKDYVVREVFSFCKEFDVSLILIGLPLNMQVDQPENKVLAEVEKFVDYLKKSISDSEDAGIRKLEVRLFDERLSSFEADEMMNEIDSKLGGRNALPRDAYAAQVILQRFFDSCRTKGII